MKVNFRSTPRVSRRDGWISALSGLGHSSFDRREHVTFESDIVTIPEARELWRGDDLAARIIDTVPAESVREGFRVTSPDEEGLEITEKLMEDWKRLGLLNAIRMARSFERAYGGGAVLIGADDGQDLDKKLNVKAIKSLDYVTWLEPDELHPLLWYSNVRGPNYGKVALFQLNPYVVGAGIERELPRGLTNVHESRLLVFPGIQTSRMVSISANGGWGDSVLTRAKRVLRDFNLSWSAAGALVMDFATPIFKMKGLDQLIAMDRDDEFKRRIQAAQMARSVLRAMLIDAEEEFTREQTPMSGLPELLDRFATRLAAAADMPVTLLMGQSPAGLNATGESDIRFFYDRTKGSQIRHEVPAIERFCELDLAWRKVKLDKFSVEPNPLWQPSEKEQADTRLVQANADNVYLMAGVLTPQQVKENRFGPDGGSSQTIIEEEDEEAPADIRVPGAGGEAPAPGAPPAGLPPEAQAAAQAAQQFNGAQIQAAYTIVAGIGKKEIPKESAKQMLITLIGVTPEVADKMAIDFTAKPDPSKPEPSAPVVKPGASGDKAPPFAKKEKMDWDPDQPREENGQFSSDGGGGGNSGEKSKLERVKDKLKSAEHQRNWARQEVSSMGDEYGSGDEAYYENTRQVEEEIAEEEKMTDDQLSRKLDKINSELNSSRLGNKHRGELEAKRDHIRLQFEHRREEKRVAIERAKNGVTLPSKVKPDEKAALVKVAQNIQARGDNPARGLHPDRLRSEITKLEAKGIDTPTAKESYAQLKEALAEHESKAEPSKHEKLAATANQHSDRARQLAAEGKLRDAAAETRRAAEAFKSATKAASPQESKNEAKARRARERRERARQEASKTPEQTLKTPVFEPKDRPSVLLDKPTPSRNETFGEPPPRFGSPVERAEASAAALRERASKEKPPESKNEAKARRARERRLRAKEK